VADDDANHRHGNATTPDARAEAGELLSLSTVGGYLAGRGLIGAGDASRAAELGGGISNVVLAVESGATRLVVKQALPRLRVAELWLAKRERAINEAEALSLADRITPGGVPALLDLDRERCALTLEAAPASWTSWKTRLLRGEVEPAVARRLGELLAAWHRGTFADAAVARDFADTEVFEQLRVDPYYRTVARRRPELAGAIDGYVRRMEASRRCLVHGDFSPKNVLVGERVWVLDFEVAHYGDPAFDVAFMLHHLVLKRIHRPAARDALERCASEFWEAYRRGVPDELLPESGYVLGHVGCLMVARVEGKSPAEYLSPRGQDAARALGARLLLAPPASLDAALRAAGDAVA
jgi:aminoglycoside phosphotransferase (APT) family kinase protein